MLIEIIYQNPALFAAIAALAMIVTGVIGYIVTRPGQQESEK